MHSWISRSPKEQFKVPSHLLASKPKDRLSVSNPSVSTYALGYGAFLGLYAHLRYQLIYGLDRAMVNTFDVIGLPLFFSTTLRIPNSQTGEKSRLSWLGVEPDPLVQSDELLKAYNRPAENVTSSSSNWFISKKALTSSLELLGIKLRNLDSDNEEIPASKAHGRSIMGRRYLQVELIYPVEN